MSSIPEGFTSVTPYVVMDDTAAAIEFYKKALGATEKMRLPTPDGNVMYAEIQVGNARMMMGHPCPEWGGKSAKSFGGSPVSFFVYVEDVEAAFKKAKDAGMSVKKEIQDMFWGDRMGTLTDPFDVDWTISQHIRDVSPEEMQEAMKNMNC
jgi:PhnB protein